jgi:hypothetical protein
MASVTIGSTTYPSFSSVADADAYLGADAIRAVPWALRNPDAKARGLVTATRLLLGLTWCGVAPTIDNPPPVLVDVTAMLAADGLARPGVFTNPSGSLPRGVKSASAGKAAVEFFSPSQVAQAHPLPSDLWGLLVAAGLVGCTADPTPNDGPFVSGASSGRCDRWPYGGIFWDDDARREGGW